MNTLISNNTTIKFNGPAVGKAALGIFAPNQLLYTTPASSYSEVTLNVVATSGSPSGLAAYATNDGGINTYSLPLNTRCLIPGGYQVYATGNFPGAFDLAQASLFGINLVNTP